jgi:HSP20 family protein
MNPFSLMRRFTDEKDRLFESSPSGRRRGEDGDFWMPALDITERDNKLVVCADLPGLKKEDVHVEINRDSLVIQGERRQTHEEKREGFHHSERSYGKFYRSIALPEGANADKAVAEMSNGTLEVSIPISETDKSRRQIPVKETGGLPEQMPS